MNFISTFEELNKLYEEAQKKTVATKTVKPVEEACAKENTVEDDKTSAVDEGIIGDTVRGAARGFLGLNEDTDEDDEIEVVEDEQDEQAEEEVDEPKQVIIACDKCGAIVLKDDSDIVIDEESDLVNVEDECQFCEETAGYNIIGVVAPYNPEEVEVVTEDLADWYRKKFDKPASIAVQQDWEDELNSTTNEKRRKHLERKFQQQRDWEARHPDETVEDLEVKKEEDEELGEGIGGAIAGGMVGASTGLGVAGTVAGAAIGSHVQNKLNSANN